MNRVRGRHAAARVRIARVAAMLVCSASLARAATPTSAPAEPRVRLVVLLVIDQFRADFLTRAAPYFCERGFRRLIDRGAWFANAYYSQAASATAAGHATIATGQTPRRHGIVANEWYLTPDATKPAPAFDDPACALVGQATGDHDRHFSPRRLLAQTLGDQLKLTDRRARVFSVALKPRSAIALGGHLADGAFWWSDPSGQCVTSSYYRAALPPALAGFNRDRWPARFFGQNWTPLLPESAYAGCRAAPDADAPHTGLGAAFPHHVPDGRAGPNPIVAIEASPYGNDVTLEIAGRLIDGEQLGAGPATDLLAISLSSFDVAGHAFGPQSAEMLDFAVQTDRQLAAFLDRLDARVGLDRCLVALSADHGVSLPPSVLRGVHLPAGVIDLAGVTKRLVAQLRASGVSPAATDDLVRGIELPWVYFTPGFYALDEAARRRVLAIVEAELARTPGVAAVIGRERLAGAAPPRDDELAFLAWRAWSPGRGGELCLCLSTGWYKRDENIAGHTVGWNHDRHVPILLAGPGVRAGKFYSPADPLDIAPTIAAVLGIEPPLGAEGRVLFEALADHPR
ncbi:MAG: alkaline phosphatase family protein [Phycisphaerae bacterium]